MGSASDPLAGWYAPPTAGNYVADGHEAVRLVDAATRELYRIRAALIDSFSALAGSALSEASHLHPIARRAAGKAVRVMPNEVYAAWVSVKVTPIISIQSPWLWYPLFAGSLIIFGDSLMVSRRGSRE